MSGINNLFVHHALRLFALSAFHLNQNDTNIILLSLPEVHTRKVWSRRIQPEVLEYLASNKQHPTPTVIYLDEYMTQQVMTVRLSLML